MAIYRWQGKTRSGQERSGEMEVANRDIAVATLRRQGMVDVKVKKKPVEIVIFPEKVVEKDITIFFRQLSTMINAGLPLVQCFELAERGAEKKAMEKLLKDVRDGLESGAPLGETMRRFPKNFDRLTCSLIEAGEQGGILDTILLRLCTYKEKALSLKAKIKSAMVYPAAIIIVSFIVTSILMIFVIPVFGEIFSSFGADLPGPTKVTMAISDAFVAYWYVVLGAPIALVFGVRYLYQTPQGRYQIDKLLLNLPVLGDVLRKGAVARFCRTFSTLAAAGVPILEAMDTVAETEGNVIIDEGPRRMSGDSLEWDLRTRTGKITNGKAFVDPGYYFTGDTIAKVGPDEYIISDGIFTSCDDEDKPPWSLALTKASITVGGYARIRNARMRFGNIPAMYFPYILWPTKTERSSGLLIPKPGYSNRRGGYLGLAYFKTLGRSADATFFLDLYSKQYYGFGTEFRYQASEHSSGSFSGFLLNEPSSLKDNDEDGIFAFFDPRNYIPGVTRNRWRIRYDHQSDNLWGGWRGILHLEEYSDLDFQQEYERDVSRQTRAEIFSVAHLSRSFGNHSLNFQVDQREIIRRSKGTGTSDVRRQLPEVEYRLRNNKLGKLPVYLSVLSSVSSFEIDLETVSEGSGADAKIQESNFGYQRADLLPEISIPLSRLPWLSAELKLGQRITWYSDSLNGADILNDDGEVIAAARTDFTGDSLLRTFPTASLELIGPSFSRIYEREGGKKKKGKLKHIIEPRIQYAYVDGAMNATSNGDDPSDQDRIFFFDEVDSLFSVNGLLFTLTNRLLAKPPPDEDGNEGSAFEIASLSFSQGLSLDDDLPGQAGTLNEMLETRSAGPISGLFRFNPNPETSFKLETRYSTLFGQVENFSLSGGSKIGNHGFGVSWFTRFNLTDDVTKPRRRSDQLRFSTSFSLLPERLYLDSGVSYDLLAKELLQQRHFIRFIGSCYSLELEYRESKLRGGLSNPLRDTDRDYRFSFTLKNVGTFLDLTGRLGSS